MFQYDVANSGQITLTVAQANLGDLPLENFLVDRPSRYEAIDKNWSLLSIPVGWVRRLIPQDSVDVTYR